MNDSSYIITCHPIKHSGVRMKKNLYDSIVGFIISNIRSTGSLDLSALLNKSGDLFPQHANINWYIYQVKLDLEARGYIKIIPNEGIRALAVTLTPAGAKTFGKEIPLTWPD
jgi:hypothetical protein